MGKQKVWSKHQYRKYWLCTRVHLYHFSFKNDALDPENIQNQFYKYMIYSSIRAVFTVQRSLFPKPRTTPAHPALLPKKTPVTFLLELQQCQNGEEPEERDTLHEEFEPGGGGGREPSAYRGNACTGQQRVSCSVF